MNNMPETVKTKKTESIVKETNVNGFDINTFLRENNSNKISYISDLHLMYRIKNEGCTSKTAIIRNIQKVIDTILQQDTFLRDNEKLTLIGGDVSSNFSIFEMFVKRLKKSNDRLSNKRCFIFILGNHELWNFSDVKLEKNCRKI